MKQSSQRERAIEVESVWQRERGEGGVSWTARWERERERESGRAREESVVPRGSGREEEQLLYYVSLSRRAPATASRRRNRRVLPGATEGRGCCGMQAVTMAQPSLSASPGVRRRSDGSVRECLFFPVSERNEQERLEALVRRRGGGAERRGGGGAGGGGGGGGEDQDHLDHRPKRWTWGGPPDGVEGNPKTPPCHAIGSAQPNELPAASSASQSRNVADFLSPPTMDQPINKQLSNSSAALHSPERASPSNHRPYRSSSNRRSIAGFPEETSRARTPTGESPSTPVRSSSFRANSKGPATPKRVRSNRSRAQSPCSPGQYPPSPLRQRATTPDDRGHADPKGHGTLERKANKCEGSEKKIPKSTSRELNAESPGTPTGRSVGGTMDAEEASRLLAERRRLARIQKEQEERQRQEEERLRAEEEQRRLQEARERQERAARQAEEERARREEERRTKEEEERRQKEQRWKDMQDQLDREREEAFLRAQKEAERKRQERELLHIQEEQERQQRKKRIEEIMKRTRKSEVEPPSAASASEGRAEAAVASEDDAPTPAEAPAITLGPLESKSCVDELSDGVQSMDVSSPSVSISPVSRDEQASAQEFSPVTEGTDGCPLEHLMDLDAPGRGQRSGAETPPYPRLQAGSGVGDLNKNLLIQAYNAASESSQLIHSIGPSKLDVQ
ncbi:MAP7 domain-containing protein 2 isoform X3 [Acanthochromis polyacanthus]|uniref:MAP7 domain-containing protein 2 isoform X3 n=1 Tax=Acanthochromis polyacanthus TaxID=80966 RepID=UPI002234E762|nr:MAP7 domain-containing protein 2 isoform X3 [Acanthochromis polyacanthus]